MKLSHISAAAACLVLSLSATAAGPQDLGETLTPSGAEKAGNGDGSIPAWSGADPALPGWSAGKPRGDFFVHKGDKVLYSIDATNADKYASQLTPGQLALVKNNKGYRMDVYPTRRTCLQPSAVSEASKKNAAGAAAIAADGWSLKSAVLPGVPFPQPKSGVEVLWNFKMRYRGIGNEIAKGNTVVSPRPGAGEWIEAGWSQVQYFAWGGKVPKPSSELPPVEAQGQFSYNAPTALAGQSLLTSAYTNGKDVEVFYYFPGQRRVRRMPNYAYDAPQIGFENQYAVDQTAMFTGSPDRFDWKIVGKREVLIPYNDFQLYAKQAKLRDIAQRDSLNPELRRYEKHRVWVIEGTLKNGVRHAAPKRTFYFDEDSWILSVAEDYDVQGKLWKLRESYPVPVFETGSCDFYPFAQYDLQEGRYLADNLTLDGGIKWFVESNESRFKDGYYTADNLRAISER